MAHGIRYYFQRLNRLETASLNSLVYKETFPARIPACLIWSSVTSYFFRGYLR
jgi:hypothetical protein